MRQKLIPCFVAAALVFTGAVGAGLLTADPTFAGKATPATDKKHKCAGSSHGQFPI